MTSFPVTANGQLKLAERLKAESIEKLADDATRFGDATRGAIAFYHPTMHCAKCHEMSSANRRLGPNLAERREVTMAHLIQSVLEPSAKIKEGFESAVATTDDGKVIAGVLVKETDTQLVLDSIERVDEPWTLAKDTIDDWEKTKTSAMPEALVNQLADRKQFLDLAAYLFEIAKEGPSRASQLRPIGGSLTLPPLPDYESRVDHAGLIGSLNDESAERGAELFRLRCASCHGTLTEEGSMPTSLRFAKGKFKNGNDPYQMYQTLTHGFGMMNPQRWMVPQQKYEVIHYIREHFLKSENPSQLFDINDTYLASLPAGDTRGPKPVMSQPWTDMNYGPSLTNTIEVSRDGSNIAQKGIVVRLDDGPGGVESGSHWMMYEHDTLRVAGAWSGSFIDWEGIHFNGAHGRHPKVTGNVQFSNPTAPGFAGPDQSSAEPDFTDDRVVGRDGKHYGPLPRDWARYLGMYRFGKQTILKYRVGNAEILESPGLTFIESQPVYTRTLNLGERDKDLVIQVANTDAGLIMNSDRFAKNNGVTLLPPAKATSESTDDADSIASTKGIVLGGANFAEIADGDQFDLANSDFSIFARIKTSEDGTIFAKTKNQDEWVPQGKTFFIRGGRLTFDIGWVGDVQSKKRVNDGEWHDVAMTWQFETKQVQFFVDGKPAGKGELEPKSELRDSVARIGFTNSNFPGTPNFDGQIGELRFYQRRLSNKELAKPNSIEPSKLIGTWNSQQGSEVPDANGDKKLTAIINGSSNSRGDAVDNKPGLLAACSATNAKWSYADGNLRLRIPAGAPLNIVISHSAIANDKDANLVALRLNEFQRAQDLTSFTHGGPPNYPQTSKTRMIRGDESGPFAVDVLERPKANPWKAQLRLTGLDFLPDGNTAIVSAWDGSVWRVSGFASEVGDGEGELTWQRIAAGLFQPLGVKYRDGKIYVTCRDQIAILHDLNGDHEADWYECFNSDHQVTEHFHEFAMGLQSDDAGNFYYAKSARHAKKAVVPHHGTLLKVSPDGSKTEILANGFRAANGVCLNPDGSFVVTDQEGHWNPKNRINWVRPGGFYGNMFGYHDETDDSDDAMDSPLCWITNAFDRSPSELLWVDSEKWGKLNGSLLNLSYGYGKVYIVPHEEVDGQMQGGMCAFPIAQFPTGVMRGRFHPGDGQLYCCGMFAWGGNQHVAGGLYRIRRTEKPVHLPVGLKATEDGVTITFSDTIAPASATDVKNWQIKVWDLKRTKNYGSKHYNEQSLDVSKVEVLGDGETIQLHIPELKPTWGMEILYSLESTTGERIQGQVHNTIYKMGG